MSAAEQWVCGYVLTFTDGGEPEEQILHVGSREDCEQVAGLIPAVAYSGPRPLGDCRMVVMPMPEEATEEATA